ncbi:MAG: inorganic diphosphatase [Cuniculiplasma sp.]
MTNNSLWITTLPGDKAPEEFNAVIETPKGSRNKYEVNKEGQGVLLDRVLHSSVMYPADYGFVPRTYYDDGDPIDVLVLTSFPLYPGIIVKCRPVGVMHMIDGGERDDKIIAVASKDPAFNDIKDINDVNTHLLKEIKNFFETYKVLEGKKTTVSDYGNAEEAKKQVEESMKKFDEKFQGEFD